MPPQIQLRSGMVALVILLLLGLGRALADQLTLNDGTVLEGTVISQGDKYWIKTADGETQLIAKDKVKSLVRNHSGSSSDSSVSGAADISAMRYKAEAQETAAAALALWQKFADANLSADKAAVQAELDKWKKLADAHAEKINGKWVGGPERDAILKKANDLLAEADALLKADKTILAVKKLEESRNVYPNFYEANFTLGNVALIAHRNDDALNYYNQCLVLRPDAPETLNNMALALWDKKLYERSILSFYKSVSAQDSLATIHNLLRAISMAPKEVATGGTCKPAVEAARLLATKYQKEVQQLAPQGFLWVEHAGKGGPDAGSESASGEPGDVRPPAGAICSGTGFAIADKGLILTCRHVINTAKEISVVLDDGQKHEAELVAIDHAHDLALIRVKGHAKLPIIAFSKADKPAEGAQCFVMGYPLIDAVGASVKITQGIVSGTGRAEMGADVAIDAKVNPGNSGGPLLDKFGHVLGVVTMKTLTTDHNDSYGLAIGVAPIREFLSKNDVNGEIGESTGAALSAEDIAAKIKPSTVLIISKY